MLCMYVCMHTCIHACMYVHMCVCVCACVFICLVRKVYIHVFVPTCVFHCKCNMEIRTDTVWIYGQIGEQTDTQVDTKVILCKSSLQRVLATAPVRFLRLMGGSRGGAGVLEVGAGAAVVAGHQRILATSSWALEPIPPCFAPFWEEGFL